MEPLVAQWLPRLNEFDPRCGSVNYTSGRRTPTLDTFKEDTMSARRIAHTLCGVVILGVLASSAVGAFIDTRRTTTFSFSGSVRLPGVVLPAGTYVFEIANHESDGDLVRVSSRDRSKVYLMAFTRVIDRAPLGDLLATITLGESSAGNPPPVKAWYPQSETRGREFLY